VYTQKPKARIQVIGRYDDLKGTLVSDYFLQRQTSRAGRRTSSDQIYLLVEDGEDFYRKESNKNASLDTR
jgi:hypothetical protein